MGVTIYLPYNADFEIKAFMSHYHAHMAKAESNCLVPNIKYSIELYLSVYASMMSQCKEHGIDIHSVKCSEEVSEYIRCIETYDSVLRQKLSVNYVKICKIAKEEYKAKVVSSFSHEYEIRWEYTKWFDRFEGVRKATEIFLNQVSDDDPDEVKQMVPHAKEFNDFLVQANSEVANAIAAFDIARKNAEREYKERREREQREREEKELIAREQKEAAERAERERLAALERRRIELKPIVDEILPIEGKILDEQQIDCVISESRNTLVIAGAGSGKTTTIIGKVKYLLHTEKCGADEILLLSFTKKSADEMKQRVKAETGIDMDVFTFHKLGLDTIARVEGRKPAVYSKTLQFFVKDDIKKYLNNKYYREELLNYCWLNPSRARSVFDFKTSSEMYEYNGSTPTITIQGEYVKSVCELEIANFLFRNRLRYTYEKPYEYNTANSQYSRYKPDFYLEDYGIYIEFYAVDRNGNVPEWLEPHHGKSARQEYHDSIVWKRRLHASHHTTIVEVSYADKQNGIMQNPSQIKKQLRTANTDSGYKHNF